ncbi:MAG TPA: DNA adenine methylase [Rectinemataceae bacterium]|nr:DNA adenine methylase [Rectinemataceae bacterium]
MHDPIPLAEAAEDPRFLSDQLVTCIGNKRALLDFIGEGLKIVLDRLGKPRIDILDAFSGSGVVSRYFKRFARRLVANDLELYADIANRCYLANYDSIDRPRLAGIHRELLGRLEGLEQEFLDGARRGEVGGDDEGGGAGFVAELYAPDDDAAIKAGERVFYTRRNALFIDAARKLIAGLDAEDRPFFLAPLLSEASIHANTAGVFKGFYKDAETGIGRFGGRAGDALSRILGDIGLPFPLFSRFSCEVETHRGDAATTAELAGDIDLAYLDPPYNQHPYGSNYFMLNLIAEGRRPERISEVSGIPRDWSRSDYNAVHKAATALEDLVTRLRAKFILLSFNSEGFLSRERMEGLLGRHGRLSVLERDYSAFKGSRNLAARPLRVKEFLYLLEK